MSKPKTDTVTFNFKDRHDELVQCLHPASGSASIHEVELVVNNASKPVEIMPEPDESWFVCPYRGFEFQAQRRILPGQSFAQAAKSGYDRTIQNGHDGLFDRPQPGAAAGEPEAPGRPDQIFRMGYFAARARFSVLVFFLGILSINLAVLNFLPIPPLDGGQMVFLIAEKVRGRPLPDSAVIAGSYVGSFSVLCLMIFVTYQDIYRLIFG